MHSKQKKAMLIAAAVTCNALLGVNTSLTASAVNGAGGYSWEATVGYQEATTSVTDNDGTTTVTFENADNDLNVAGFCCMPGEDWSDYTQLSLTVANNSNADVDIAIALGTGADWAWHQAVNNATIEAGKSADLTYYLTAEEWSLDGTVCAVADLFQTQRINMMVMSPYGAGAVSGEIVVSALSLGGSSSEAVEPKDGFYVDGAVLRDANQQPFVMRGTNYAYTWFSWEGNTEETLKEIASYGANAVRIVLGDGQQYTANSNGEVANLIALCEKYNLVAIMEVHDATGKDDAAALNAAANYFATTVSAALKGHEDTVLINIANEWQGSANDTAWQNAYIDAVKTLRDAGLKHCIMCDAGGWGQNASTVINGGAAVLAADPEHNCMFSVHMYGTAGGNETIIKSTIDSMITRQLCLVIGEFGYTHSDGDVDEGFIMRYCNETNTGWLAWSWYGNGSPVEYLDMTSANVGGTLSKDWGEVVINGEYGWKATSKTCSVFTGDVTTTTTSSSTTTTTTETTTSTVETTTSESTSVQTTTTPYETTTSAASTTTPETTTGKDVQQTLRGDIDCSGEVSITDAILLCRYNAEDASISVSAQGLANADCNADGLFSAEDVTIILRIVARLEA